MATSDTNILDLLNIVSSDTTEDFIKHINPTLYLASP